MKIFYKKIIDLQFRQAIFYDYCEIKTTQI